MKKIQSCLVSFLVTLALLTSYLSLVLCDFLRVEASGEEDSTEKLELGIFCSVKEDPDSGYNYDTDSSLWKIARALSVMSLLLGLAASLISYSISIVPKLTMRNQDCGNMIWHCLSAFCSISAVLEVWALLPYASGVCSYSNESVSQSCHPGSGTYLLGLSFVFYFLAAFVVELTEPPVQSYVDSNRDVMVKEEEKNKSDDIVGVDIYDVYSPSVTSNVSSITKETVFLQMEKQLRDTLENIDEDLEEQRKVDSVPKTLSVVSGSMPNVASAGRTSPSIMNRTNSMSRSLMQPMDDLTMKITERSSVSGSTPNTTPEKTDVVNYDLTDNTIHYVHGSLPKSALRKSPRSSPPTIHENNRRSSTPTGILKKSRFSENAPDASREEGTRRKSPSPIQIRIRNSPEVAKEVEDAMNDPNWPQSVQLSGDSSRMSSSTGYAAYLAKKRVRVNPGLKSLADSSDDEAPSYSR